MRGFLILPLVLFVSFNAYSMGKPTNLPRFHEVVKDKIYRGGVPTEEGIHELAQAHMRTILNIRDENPLQTEEEGELVKKLGMDFISIPISALSSPSDQDMDAIESALANPSSQPIFIHCTQGQDRTGLAIALYRVFQQKENPKDAYQEMVDLGFHKILVGLSHYFEQKTGFDTDDTD